MSILVVLVGCSLVVASGFLIAFIWAVKNGQFDDTETPALRLISEPEPNEASKDKKSEIL